jgi:hypothetical protein
MDDKNFNCTAFTGNNGGGYTWTLASRTGAILQELEGMYGPRDKSWTLLGIEFGPDTPKLWYPGLREGRRDVIIQLSRPAFDSHVLACYQLAHECVHLLGPHGDNASTVLDEGLATLYSTDFVTRNFHCQMHSGMPSYDNALDVVRRLLTAQPAVICKLRALQPSLSRVTTQTFIDASLTDIDSALRDEAVAQFVR